MQGFSKRNLHTIKHVYHSYNQDKESLHQLGGKFEKVESSNNAIRTGNDERYQQILNAAFPLIPKNKKPLTNKINEVCTLFEEIKKQLKQIGKKQLSAPEPVPQPQIEVPDLSVIPELTNKLDEVIGEVRKPVKTEHRHIFSFESNKIFFCHWP